MISNLLKTTKPDIYQMTQNNKYTKPLVKHLDITWKKIETLLEKELKSKLGK
jgi:hypothetical protein